MSEVTRSALPDHSPRQPTMAVCLTITMLGTWLSAVTPAHADFDGPYSLTPPDPGIHLLPEEAPVGNWMFAPLEGGDGYIDTSDAPSRLMVGTLGPLSNGGYLYTTAAASGLVEFDFSIEGNGDGEIGFFSDPTTPSPLFDPVDLITDLVSIPTHISLTVEEGDYFGFYLVSRGDIDNVAARSLTVENLVAPVPEPSTVMLLSFGVVCLAYRVARRRQAS